MALRPVFGRWPSSCRGFEAIKFLRSYDINPMPTHPKWTAMLCLFFQRIALNLSGMGGPTSSYAAADMMFFTLPCPNTSTTYVSGRNPLRITLPSSENINNPTSVTITIHWSTFEQWSLLRKSNKYYIFWVCVCNLSYPACKAHAPYYIVICGLSGSTIFVHII
jgi:hypothetical protein